MMTIAPPLSASFILMVPIRLFHFLDKITGWLKKCPQNSKFSKKHDSLQFTIEISEKELPFLDILVIKEGMKITTDLYYKKTDPHQYLIFDSCHPSHTKRNIAFNMAWRICTIVVDEERWKTRLSELKIFLTIQK